MQFYQINAIKTHSRSCDDTHQPLWRYKTTTPGHNHRPIHQPNMIDEHCYLPYTSSELPQCPWLIIAPHPDDETFGMGGSILKIRQTGTPVTVVILTDGALGCPGKDIPDIVTQREQEARHATDLLGGVKLLYWRYPDRHLMPDQSLIRRLRTLIETKDYGAIFFPMPAEPHPDHRAAAQLTWEAWRYSNSNAIPISYEISTQGMINQLVDITDVVAAKAHAMRAYISQDAETVYIPRILAMNRARTWSLPTQVTHAEGFFRWPNDRRSLQEVWCECVSPWFTPAALGILQADDIPSQNPCSKTNQADLQALLQQCAMQEQALQAILSSRSWRLTHGLRTLYSWLRRLRKQAAI